MVLIPMMRTYLGHQTFHETAYYLRWTADVFPDIRMKLEKCYKDIIPERGGKPPMKPTDFSMHLTAFLSDYLPCPEECQQKHDKILQGYF